MLLTRRAGGLIAAAQALLWMTPLVILATGGHGVPSPGSVNDPSEALSVIKSSHDVSIVTTLMCVAGAAQVAVVLALTDRLSNNSPTPWIRLGHTFGIIAAGFLMIDGALGLAALPQLAHIDVKPGMAEAAYLAIVGVRNGIDRAICLALGIWALTTNAAGMRSRRLPRPLGVIGLLSGTTGVVGTLLPTAGSVGVAVALVWDIGLAMLLLRRPPAPDNPYREARTADEQGQIYGTPH